MHRTVYVTATDEDGNAILDLTAADVEQAVRVDADEWAAELEGIEQWYQRFGESLPAELSGELQRLKERFAV